MLRGVRKVNEPFDYNNLNAPGRLKALDKKGKWEKVDSTVRTVKDLTVTCKFERHYTKGERVGRGVLATAAAVFTLGLALFSRDVRKLYTDDIKSVSFGVNSHKLELFLFKPDRDILTSPFAKGYFCFLQNLFPDKLAKVVKDIVNNDEFFENSKNHIDDWGKTNSRLGDRQNPVNQRSALVHLIGTCIKAGCEFSDDLKDTIVDRLLYQTDLRTASAEEKVSAFDVLIASFDNNSQNINKFFAILDPEIIDSLNLLNQSGNIESYDADSLYRLANFITKNKSAIDEDFPSKEIADAIMTYAKRINCASKLKDVCDEIAG